MVKLRNPTDKTVRVTAYGVKTVFAPGEELEIVDVVNSSGETVRAEDIVLRCLSQGSGIESVLMPIPPQ